MKLNFSEYSAIFFDCDGVILNSNSIKTSAFYHIAYAWGPEVAQLFANYHMSNGGISRYVKIDHLVNSILPSIGVNLVNRQNVISDLLLQYQACVFEKLCLSEMTSALPLLSKLNPDSLWFVVSGGLETELRSVFKEKNIDSFFKGGIYGSPNTMIMANVIQSYRVFPEKSHW